MEFKNACPWAFQDTEAARTGQDLDLEIPEM